MLAYANGGAIFRACQLSDGHSPGSCLVASRG
jgi:hypothetical protein